MERCHRASITQNQSYTKATIINEISLCSMYRVPSKQQTVFIIEEQN